MELSAGWQVLGDGGYITRLQQRGRRNGYRLMPRGKHSPTVGTPLRDVERLTLTQQLQNRQVVDGATAASREAETRAPLPALPREGAAGA